MDQWNREQTLLLIAKYKEKEVLYRSTHPDYLKKHKKIAALGDIFVELKDVKPYLTIEEIKKKIQILNQQIAQEKIRRGMVADAVYTPTLWCYKELSFLLDANDEVRGHSRIECDNNMNTTSSDSDTSEPRSRKRRKNAKGEEISALLQISNKSIELVQKLLGKKEEDSREELFCQMLCSELKELKLEETYDNVTADLFALVKKAIREEREMLKMTSYGT